MTVEKKSFGILLQESFSFFTRNILPLTKAVLSVYVPLLFLSTLNFFLFAVLGDHPETRANPFKVLWVVLGGITIFLIMIVFYFLYQIVVIKAIQWTDQGESIEPGRLYRESWALLSGYFGVMVRVIMRVFLWSLLLVIPGIIFGILYSYASLAFLVDGQKDYQALVYSKKVIKPAVWKFLGNILVVGLLMLPVYMLINLVLSMIFGPLDQEAGGMAITGTILGHLMGVIVGVYPAVFFYFLYQELKKPFEAQASVEVEL